MPSSLSTSYKQPTVSIDSGFDDDGTSDALNMMLAALTAYGHHPDAIRDWVLTKAEDMADDDLVAEFGLDKEHYL